jgi:integrase
MSVANFVKVYREERGARVKESTLLMKDNIIDTKLVPYFGKKCMREITTKDVMLWQNAMLAYRDPKDGAPYSKSYLKTIHNQLSAIFNHAVRYYKLAENPARTVGNMGSEKGIEMKYWTREEYLKFSEYMMDDPVGHYYFQMLYWCGLREGEALALTLGDFDFAKKTVSITKTFQHLKGKDVITEPKTPKSNRTVEMPDFLVEDIRDYVGTLYDLKPEERLFPLSKSYLYRKMEQGSKATGLQRIRVHDLRHSHVSLLIHMGYSAVAIAERMGHESIDITFRYAHLFPTVQRQMAADLNALQEGGDENVC